MGWSYPLPLAGKSQGDLAPPNLEIKVLVVVHLLPWWFFIF
jgi:hypothetical protein